MRSNPFQRPCGLGLALQGGGAHGAFTWGVLDRLLQQPDPDIKAISGTSAGAMNAVAVAQGLLDNGRQGARDSLDRFWQAVADSSHIKFGGVSTGQTASLSPAVGFMMQLTHYFSPYQLNPFDINPLRTVVEEQFDFDALRQHSPVELFIAATNANSGRLRLFREHELTSDCVLASACLPTVHHSIEIDGEPYWDGAFSANPAVLPLYQHSRCSDILMVLLAPMVHGELPTSASGIQERAREIAFCSGFLREMRLLAQLRQQCSGRWQWHSRQERRLQQLNFHLVDPQGALDDMSYETKLVPDSKRLLALRDLGERQADHWLKQHRPNLGHRSSINLAEVFL